MDEGIQFVAKMGDWLAVKKLKVEEKTDPLTVLEFLAGLSVSFDFKIREYIGKEVDVKRIESAVDEELEGIARGAKGIDEALAKVKGLKIGKIINELCGAKGWQPKQTKELKEFCKVYALRYAFVKAGLKVDYSSIDTPAIKAARKKAAKTKK